MAGMGSLAEKPKATSGCAAGALALLIAVLAAGARPVGAADFQAGLEAARAGDDARALEEWLPLARSGDLDAQFNVAALYERGIGVARDLEAAAQWQRRAAERRFAPAEYALGRMYQLGRGVARDPRKALELFQRAAGRGFPEAQFALGLAYDHGLGVRQDLALAAEWYRRAAEQDLPEAQYNLAVLYEQGLGVPSDTARALAWYLRAAEGGSAPAQNNLGYLYQHGVGVSPDQKAAVEWYRKAAEQGFALAQTNLAIMYHFGTGVGLDYLEAVRWYRRAAEQDDALAQNGLGLMYANGLGVEQRFAEAYKWFELAASGGDGDLAQSAARDRERLAESMTPAEIEAARAQASALRAALSARLQESVESAIVAPRTTRDFGQPVVTAQRWLKELGYYEGRVDGIPGPMTETAVRAFQRDRDLAADGAITEDLLAALERTWETKRKEEAN